jgi:hypothetical protein
MPTLDLPNLAAYTYQKQTTPPPIATPAGATIAAGSSSATVPCPPCYSGQQPYLNLVCQQGQTLTVLIQLLVKDANGVSQPVDITGNKFEFTAKIDINLPDTDLTVVKWDWQETSTPTQGITSLALPASMTASFELVPYFYQVRMVSSLLSPAPIVTPLFSGTLTVVQPVSIRPSVGTVVQPL